MGGYICKDTGVKGQPMQTSIASLFAIQQSIFTGLDTLLFSGIFGRSMFEREHRMGAYSIPAYILSAVVVSLPTTLIGSFLECVPYILMVGWQGSYYHFWTFLMTQFNCSVFASYWINSWSSGYSLHAYSNQYRAADSSFWNVPAVCGPSNG